MDHLGNCRLTAVCADLPDQPAHTAAAARRAQLRGNRDPARATLLSIDGRHRLLGRLHRPRFGCDDAAGVGARRRHPVEDRQHPQMLCALELQPGGPADFWAQGRHQLALGAAPGPIRHGRSPSRRQARPRGWGHAIDLPRPDCRGGLGSAELPLAPWAAAKPDGSLGLEGSTAKQAAVELSVLELGQPRSNPGTP